MIAFVVPIMMALFMGLFMALIYPALRDFSDD